MYSICYSVGTNHYHLKPKIYYISANIFVIAYRVFSGKILPIPLYIAIHKKLIVNSQQFLFGRQEREERLSDSCFLCVFNFFINLEISFVSSPHPCTHPTTSPSRRTPPPPQPTRCPWTFKNKNNLF